MEDLKEKQAGDPSLEFCRKQAQTGEVNHTGKRNNSWYGYEKGVLVRFFQSPTINFGDVFRQVVVPTELRTTVMQLAHDFIMSGHLAARKTTQEAKRQPMQLRLPFIPQCISRRHDILVVDISRASGTGKENETRVFEFLRIHRNNVTVALWRKCNISHCTVAIPTRYARSWP